MPAPPGGEEIRNKSLDLGQKQDFTAIAVVERAEVATGEINRVTYERIRETHFGLRYLERVKLGTSYPAIVERVRQVLEGRRAGRGRVRITIWCWRSRWRCMFGTQSLGMLY